MVRDPQRTVSDDHEEYGRDGHQSLRQAVLEREVQRRREHQCEYGEHDCPHVERIDSHRRARHPNQKEEDHRPVGEFLRQQQPPAYAPAQACQDEAVSEETLPDSHGESALVPSERDDQADSKEGYQRNYQDPNDRRAVVCHLPYPYGKGGRSQRTDDDRQWRLREDELELVASDGVV